MQSAINLYVTKIAKANCAKLQVLHTSDSVSYACSEHDLAMKLGRPPRRDETYIKTHTRKNGVPSSQAEPIINKLQEIVEACPELKDRTIQQGDAFAVVCGEKEPKGYVCAMGLGPTPQGVGTSGLKCYTPTRLQMEILARKKVENEKHALEQCLDQLHAQMDLMERRAEQDRASLETMSQHGYNSWKHVNTRADEIGDAGQHEDHGEEDYGSADNECYEEEDQNLLGQMHDATPSLPARNISATERNKDVPHSAHDELVGKDVILYAMLRSNQPVAKGTIISTIPSTVLGGQDLGKQFCEVIVTLVLKRDAMLPRP